MIRFAIVTDPHCTSVAESSAPQKDPNARFRTTVRWLVRRLPDLDFVVFSGDLIGDPHAESYAVFSREAAPLTVPHHYLVGNHDLRGPFRSHLLKEELGPLNEQPDRPIYYEFFADPTRPSGLRCLALDTLVDGKIGGQVTPEQIGWVRSRIQDDPLQPTLVFMHHPPLPTGIDWIDEEPTQHGRALLQTLSAGNVLGVFFGHVHMEMGLAARGIPCFGTPATTRQFNDGFDRPKSEWDRPAVRMVTVDGNEVMSYVDRVPFD